MGLAIREISRFRNPHTGRRGTRPHSARWNEVKRWVPTPRSSNTSVSSRLNAPADTSTRQRCNRQPGPARAKRL
eukprot:16195-Lingulodinium_polyedra.AAC.1